MARFTLEVGSTTDVGRQRQRNEDSLAVFVPEDAAANPSHLGGLLLVADGMGGERAGDRASQMTAERLRAWLASGEYRGWPEFNGPRPLEGALERGVRTVSAEIYQLGQDDAEVRGLGSTVVVLTLVADQAVLAHVGDSRAYLIRDGSLRQLTVDHSWVQRQVDAGVLDPAAARRHPQRNILTRSLGDSLPPEVDVGRLEVTSGDRFILCSDGLNGGVSDREILDLSLEHTEPQALADALVERANEQDGSDNITVVVGDCRPLDPDGELDAGSTHRIHFDDEPTAVLDELFDGDTRVDLQHPADDAETLERIRVPSVPRWRRWWVAAILALALGLLAGFLIQKTQGPTSSTVETETSATATR
ncbi:MAG: PP2C family serine/threonine-protein phosphatase [Acidobacteriota bacterium]